MTRIWIQQGEDGFDVCALDLIGFATYAPTEPEALARAENKLPEHLLWLEIHGLPAPAIDPGVKVVERVGSDDVLFGADREPATRDQIELTLALLQATRSDLVRVIDPIPDEVLDWDPPYRRFAVWATWRTIRAVLAHVANTETHYYLRNIGFEPRVGLADPAGEWHSFLPASRSGAVMALRSLQASSDLARVGHTDRGQWSVRKALRCLVRHEIMHTRSIERILRDYESQSL